MRLMIAKEELLNSIIDDIFKLDSPPVDVGRRKQIGEFVISSVNGDNPVAHLVTNATLGENNKGAIVYILTDLRLIKVDIGAKEIKSNSFPVYTIIGVERKLLDDGRSQFSVSFQSGSFGLKYSQDDKKITDFFQKIEARAS